MTKPDQKHIAAYICIWCGFQYPTCEPTDRDLRLRDHIKVCDKHPLSNVIQAAHLAMTIDLEYGVSYPGKPEEGKGDMRWSDVLKLASGQMTAEDFGLRRRAHHIKDVAERTEADLPQPTSHCTSQPRRPQRGAKDVAERVEQPGPPLGPRGTNLSAPEAAHEGLIDDAPCAYVYHGDLLGPCGFPRAWHHSKSHAYVAPEPAATSDHDDAPCACGLPQNHQFHEGHKWGHDYQPIVKPALCASCNHKEHGDGTPCRKMIKVKVRDGGVVQGCPSHIEERMCFCCPKVYREVHGLPEPPAPAMDDPDAPFTMGYWIERAEKAEADLASVRADLADERKRVDSLNRENDDLVIAFSHAQAELKEERDTVERLRGYSREDWARLRAREAELQMRLVDAVNVHAELLARAESAEARVRDLEAKIEAVEAWGRRWFLGNGSHALWAAFDAALGKEQPNG